MKTQPPWVLLCTLIAGGGLTAIAQAFQSALPQGATLIANIVAIIVAVAGLVVTYYQAVEAGANAPAKSLAAPGPNGNIPVVDTATGHQISSVVTTSSTLPIAAPQKEGS